MLDCKRVLEGAKAELHVLDAKDLEPEKIKARLAGCMVRTGAFLITVVPNLLKRFSCTRLCYLLEI